MQFIGAFFCFFSMFFPFLLSQALARHFGCYHCCNEIPHAPGAQCLIFFMFFNLLIVFFVFLHSFAEDVVPFCLLFHVLQLLFCGSHFRLYWLGLHHIYRTGTSIIHITM